MLGPESEGWAYFTRSYDGPREGNLRVLYFGLDERPPEEQLTSFFMLYTLDGIITEIEEISPTY